MLWNIIKKLIEKNMKNLKKDSKLIFENQLWNYLIYQNQNL